MVYIPNGNFNDTLFYDDIVPLKHAVLADRGRFKLNLLTLWPNQPWRKGANWRVINLWNPKLLGILIHCITGQHLRECVYNAGSVLQSETGLRDANNKQFWFIVTPPPSPPPPTHTHTHSLALIFGTLWRPRTKEKTKNKRSPQGNSKDWGSPQGILCTKSIGVS